MLQPKPAITSFWGEGNVLLLFLFVCLFCFVFLWAYLGVFTLLRDKQGYLYYYFYKLIGA